MQNSVISTRITCLYGSQLSSLFFACKTAPFGEELQVSLGSSPHLWFCAMKTATLETKLHVSMGPRFHLWFCACKTECLASILLVPMGPALICGFSIQNSDSWTRITCLYGSQTSPVVLWVQNIVISIRIASLYVFQPSSVFFACKQRLLDQNYKSLCVPDLTCRFVHAKRRD